MVSSNQEGLPDYWGIEKYIAHSNIHHFVIRKDYPTTGVLKLWEFLSIDLLCHLIRKDYPTTGVLKPLCESRCTQIGLLAMLIRKDYPTTGVLKLCLSRLKSLTMYYAQGIRKDYPTTGVSKLSNFCLHHQMAAPGIG